MKTNENTMDLRRFFRQAAKSKWIYICSLIIFGALAAIYLVRAMPQYVVSGAMLIEDSSEESSAVKGGALAMMMKTFSVGGFGASSVDNEVHLAGSHDVMLRTVRELGLNRIYTGSRDGRREVLYPYCPVKVEAPEEFFDTLRTSFKVVVETAGNGKADIRVEKGLLGTVVARSENVVLPATISTPYGPLTVAHGNAGPEASPEKITVNICGNEAAAQRLFDAVSIGIDDKMADIVDLRMKYPSRQLGTAIVNTLMEQYIAKRSERRRQTASEAIEYYNERIAAVADELAQAEKRSSDYKKSHGIAAVETEAEIMATAKLEGTMEAVKARSEIDYYTKVLETVNGRLGKNTLIPAIESFRDTSVAVYNSLISRRVNLEKSARPGNPALEKLNEQIAMLSASISDNATKIIDKARNDLKVKQQIVGSAGSRLSQYPEIEREYTEILRDREFKNQLYLFLLQNRENAVLKLYANSNPAYIYEPAYTDLRPSPLKPLLAVAGALFLALMLPTLWVIYAMRRNDTISDPMDLAFLGLEDNTVIIDQDGKHINRLRTLLIARSEGGPIFITSPSGTYVEFIASLKKSFGDAGLSLSEAPVVQSNSELLNNLNSLPTNTPGSYTLITVPEFDKLSEIGPSLDKPGSLLVILLKIGMTTRRDLRTAIKGRRTDTTVVAILAD